MVDSKQNEYLCPSSRLKMFSCEFSKISNNNFSYRTPPVAAFDVFAKVSLLFFFLKNGIFIIKT